MRGGRRAAPRHDQGCVQPRSSSTQGHRARAVRRRLPPQNQRANQRTFRHNYTAKLTPAQSVCGQETEMRVRDGPNHVRRRRRRCFLIWMGGPPRQIQGGEGQATQRRCGMRAAASGEGGQKPRRRRWEVRNAGDVMCACHHWRVSSVCMGWRERGEGVGLDLPTQMDTKVQFGSRSKREWWRGRERRGKGCKCAQQQGAFFGGGNPCLFSRRPDDMRPRTCLCTLQGQGRQCA